MFFGVEGMLQSGELYRHAITEFGNTWIGSDSAEVPEGRLQGCRRFHQLTRLFQAGGMQQHGERIGVSQEYHIELLRWDNSGWVPMDAPWVVWSDWRNSRLEIFLRYWDGASWAEDGNSASGGGVSNTLQWAHDPDIVVDSLGRVTVVWEDDFPTGRNIYLKRWDGVEWGELGGSASGGGLSNSAAASTAPAVASGDKMICVAWTEFGRVLREVQLRCIET